MTMNPSSLSPMMERRYITITPATPPPTGTEYVGHDTVPSNRQMTRGDLAMLSSGLMPGWFFNDDQHSGPSFGVSLTGPDPQYDHSGQGEGTNTGDPFFDFNEHIHPRFSSFPQQTAGSPDLSLFSMLPFLHSLELSGGDYSPVSVGDSPLPHLLSEVNDGFSPSMSALSPPLSPLAFAIPPDTHDSGNQYSLLFQEDDVLSDFTTPSDRTVEVGSFFDRNAHSPFAGASALTTSSSSGSCHSNPSPFLLSSPQLPCHSSPDTDYGSSTSFLRAHGSEESAANNSEQGTSGNSTFTGKEIGSEAGWLASEKRRIKIPKYFCTFCPRRLTSRDNWISHLDVHNNIKRYSCEYCPDRRFRTRAVLKRHQKSSRCGKRSTQ